jgi:4a-hydroxytetrahydrobiopterin dehydratase
MTKLSGTEIQDQAPAGWAYLPECLYTRIKTPNFLAGLAVVTAVAEVAEAMNHHPDLDLRYPLVGVRLTSHDLGAVTDRDIRLAAEITRIATEAGLTCGCDEVSKIDLALDSPAFGAVLPFWRAVLAMADRKGVPDEIRDPTEVLPPVWFQTSGADEPRQRWHPDVWVDPAQVQPRIDAALAAGGELVSDSDAPSFWVLADPEGNRVCLCTWRSRER